MTALAAVSPPIVVDTREPALFTQGLKLLLGDGVPFRREALNSGDYVLMDEHGGTLAIERKTVMDFLGSLADGRLKLQMERMLADFDHRLLVIEGTYRRNGSTGKVHVGTRGSGWHFTSMMAALLSLQGTFDVRVAWVNDEVEFAELLRVLYAQGREGRFHL